MNDNKLRRQNGVIAGVCGGLGTFFGISPLWFRIFFLIAALPGGISVIPYFLLWIIVPRR